MTDFEFTLVQVQSLFETSGYKVVESLRHFIRLESSKTFVTIAYDPRENGFVLCVGLLGKTSNMLTERSLREVFNYNKRISSNKDFLIDFLRNEGVSILNCDTKKFIELNSHEQKEAEIYTINILNKQVIASADSAWARKDYSRFIKEIEKIKNKDELPLSYKMKHKMAIARSGTSNE